MGLTEYITMYRKSMDKELLIALTDATINGKIDWEVLDKGQNYIAALNTLGGLYEVVVAQQAGLTSIQVSGGGLSQIIHTIDLPECGQLAKEIRWKVNRTDEVINKLLELLKSEE